MHVLLTAPRGLPRAIGPHRLRHKGKRGLGPLLLTVHRTRTLGALTNFTHRLTAREMLTLTAIFGDDDKVRMEGVSATYQSGDLGTDHDVDPLVEWGDKGDKLRKVRRST